MTIPVTNNSYKYMQSVAGRFAITVSLVSLFIGLFVAVSIAYVKNEHEQDDRAQMIDRIYFSNEETLTNSLWMMNTEVVDTVLIGLLNLPRVEEVMIITDNGTVLKKGQALSQQTVIYEYPLLYSFQGQDVSLGSLSIIIGMDNIFSQTYHSTKYLFLIIISISLGSGGITVLLFNRMIGQHLKKIAEHSANLNFSNMDVKLSLRRQKRTEQPPDELEQIARSFNTMCHSLKQSLQEIQSKEVMFEEIVTNSSDIIFRLDLEGNIIYANPAAEEQMDDSLRDVIKEIVLLESYSELHTMKKTVKLTVQTHETKDYLDARSYSLCLSPEFSAHDNVKTIIGIAHDITAHSKELEFLRAIFAHAPALMIISDISTGCCSDLNQKFFESTGYNREQTVGSTLVELGFIHPQDRDRISLALKEEGMVEDIELNTTIANGKNMICRYSCQIINVEGEQKLLSIAHDITLEKQMTMEQDALRNQLTQASKMEAIGTLAGGIAHDFNNILSVVIGFTELALDATDPRSSVTTDLQEVHTAGVRAKQLVSQILTFARQSDEELKPIQISSIMKEVLKFIRSSIPTTIKINHQIESDSLVMANSTQVHRIMMNLCTNAAHAMEKQGGNLEITLKDITVVRTTTSLDPHLQLGSYIKIEVSDTGNGIAPHIVNKIFEPYFTTKKAGEGTGMGLAMVHGIVETYGGKIYVKSTLGRGTIFTIYLPVAKEGKPCKQHNAEKLPTGQERILFVDDDILITKIANRILGQLGYHVTTTTSSVEAFERFSSKPNDFDLVISDVTMPEMTGDQLTKKLLEIKPNIPIILCTGYSKNLSEEKISEIGAKALIYKPIVAETFANTVRRILDTTNIS